MTGQVELHVTSSTLTTIIELVAGWERTLQSMCWYYDVALCIMENLEKEIIAFELFCISR